jgi:PAS domain-containing protein
MSVLYSTPAHELPSNNTSLRSNFAYFDWNLPENKMTICPYLSEILAFETTDITQAFNAWYDLNHLDDIIHIDSMLESIKNKQTLYAVSESRTLCRDGQWRWFGMRGKVIELDNNGNPLRVVGTCTDITKLKETEILLEQAQLLSFEIKRIKECQKDSFQLQDTCEEIIQSFEKFTHHSKAQFIFSSHANPKAFHDPNGCDINTLKLSAEETKFIECIFDNEEHGFQNDDKIPLLGIYFNLPFNQRAILMCKRSESFNENFLDFIVPLIEAATNILSINIVKNNERKAHAPIASFVEHLPSPVAIFDNQMSHLYVNNAWKIVTNLSDEQDFLGKSHYEVYLNQPAIWKEQHQKALNGEVVRWPPEKVCIWYGENWHSGFTFPWYTSSGSIGGVVIYANEITEQIAKLEKAEIQLQEKCNELSNVLSFLIEQMPASVALFDTEMRHKFVSDSWKRENNLGEPHEFIGKTYYEVYPKEPEIWRKNHQKVLNGEIITWPPTKYVDFSGKISWYEGAFAPWRAIDGSIAGLIMYSNDVTENVMSEKNLKKLIDDLKCSNEALEHSNTSLRHSNKALESFAHICSHDLKEPLRSISNFIHLLFVRNLEFFDEESLLYMRHALKGIDRMGALIQDILLYSKIAGRTEHKKTLLDMGKLISEINDAFNYQITEIGAEINIEDLPPICFQLALSFS